MKRLDKVVQPEVKACSACQGARMVSSTVADKKVVLEEGKPKVVDAGTTTAVRAPCTTCGGKGYEGDEDPAKGLELAKRRFGGK